MGSDGQDLELTLLCGGSIELLGFANYSHAFNSSTAFREEDGAHFPLSLFFDFFSVFSHKMRQ